MLVRTINRRKLIINSMILLVFLLVGCGGTTLPSESIGKQVFENLVKEKVDKGILKIISFKKVNGQSYEILGVKGYKLEFESEIEYLQDVKGQAMFSPAIITIHKKGDIDKEKGTLTFEQTEKGWKGQDGKIY